MAMRKRYDSRFKAQVLCFGYRVARKCWKLSRINALFPRVRGGSEYRVHANQITKWKRRVLDELPGIFSNKRERSQRDNEALQAELYRQIGQLKVELDWLKKKAGVFS